MDKLSSKYTPKLRTDDDAFTEPSGRTNADLSIRWVRRGEAHHKSSDFSGLSASLLPIDPMTSENKIIDIRINIIKYVTSDANKPP